MYRSRHLLMAAGFLCLGGVFLLPSALARSSPALESLPFMLPGPEPIQLVSIAANGESHPPPSPNSSKGTASL